MVQNGAGGGGNLLLLMPGAEFAVEQVWQLRRPTQRGIWAEALGVAAQGGRLRDLTGAAGGIAQGQSI